MLNDVTVNQGDIVFDCGANVGFFSAMLGNHDCTCYAFEPLPQNISVLEKMASVNPHIIIAPYAVSDIAGNVEFTSSTNCSPTTQLFSGEHQSEDADVITVEAVTIDLFVSKNKINKVDFIKADIEGAERLLLKGARETLKEFAPKLSICKYHLPDDPQVLRELILDANPNYVIDEKYKKIYAYVPKI